MDNHTSNTPLKKCKRCEQEYPATPEFWYRMKSMPDGLQTQCKACLKAYDQWRHGNGKSEHQAQLKTKRELLEQGLQPCSKCGEIKPFSEFYTGSKKHGRKSGYHSACKACYAEAMGWQHTPRKQFPEPPEGFKYCTKCDQLKTVSEYYTGSSRKDNLTPRCKQCELEDSIQERVARGVKLREKLPDGFKRCARCKEVKPASEDHFNHSRDNWWSAYCKPCLIKWREENHIRLRPQKVLNVAKRRARKAQLPATFTESEWQRCLEWWGHKCAYCDQPRDLFRKMEQEHIIAVVKGGGYTADNIIPACRTCNVTKGKRSLEIWLDKTYSKQKAKKLLDRINAYVEWVRNQ